MRGSWRRGKKPDSYRLQLFDRSTGKRPSKTIYHLWNAAGDQYAEDEVARWRLEYNQTGTDIASTVGYLLTTWQLSLDRSPSTLTDYRVHARIIDAEIGTKYVHEITALALDRMYAKLAADGRSPSQIKKVHTVGSAAFSQAVRWGMCPVNPSRDATPPTVDRPAIVPISAGDLAKAIKHVGDTEPWSTFLRAAVVTGARPGELCGLQPGDLNGTTLTIQRGVVRDDQARKNIVRPTKTKKIRTITIDSATADCLTRLGQDRTWIFSSDDALRSTSSVTTWWYRVRRVTGITSTFYAIRHHAATQLLASGMDPVTVAGRLGHSPDVLLRTYAHFVPAKDEEAAEILGELYG